MKTKLAILTALISTQVQAADTVIDAITQGKVSLEGRLRYEAVDDDSTTHHSGAAFTNRLVLGYKTADFHGLTAGIEFENVAALIDDNKYNSGVTGEGNRNVGYPSISDPYLTQVNQIYLDYKGLKFGRQKIVFDNARFIGDVGWRQNDQTFDAVLYANKTLIPMTQFSLAYLTRVHSILGASRDVAAPLLNVKVSPNATTNIAAFYYAVEEKSTPLTSWDHAGFRADGSFGGFLYDVSWATQSEYEKGVTPDADYSDIQLGYKFEAVTIKAQYEVLDKGFKTPLATLHAFNGWDDRFLTTPVNGLEDMNIKLLAPLWGTNVVVAYHQFSAQATDQDFGKELDISVGKKFNDKFSGLIKYAGYSADDGAPGALGKDVNKFWLQVQYKFM